MSESNLIDQLGELEEFIHTTFGETRETRQSIRSLKKQAEEMMTSMSQLQALVRLLAHISGSLQMEEVLEAIMDTLIEVLGAERGYIMVQDEADGELHIRTARNWDKETLSANDIFFSRNAVKLAIQQRSPIIVDNAQDDARLLDASSVQMYDLRSIACIPLKLQNRVFGVLYADNRLTNGIFTPRLIPLMEALAHQAAISIENARLYSETAEYSYRLEEMVEQRTAQLEQANREAEEARAVAEAVSESKSAFLSSVSHEIRTPMTSVVGFARLIQKNFERYIAPNIQSDDRKVLRAVQNVQENIRTIVLEGERLTHMVNNVLDLAKIEAGRVEWQMEPTHITTILERASSATASLFEEKGLNLIMEVDDELPVIIADEDRLIQVVINLISNAIKFSAAGSIICRASRVDESLLVSVIDRGIGIAPENQPLIFEKFRQVNDTLSDNPVGTGLGLPICKEIVEHHGGRIQVESKPGEGSTFSFTVPVAR